LGHKGIAVARQNGRYSSRKKLETDRNKLGLFTKLYPLNMLLQNKRALAKIVCGSEDDRWPGLKI
jgi:hypothetical protein